MIFLMLLFLLAGCQEADLSQDAALKRRNQKGEYIYRKACSRTEIPPMELVKGKCCQAEEKHFSKLPKITKEYFRCKGSSMNPIKTERVRGESVRYTDCGGAQKHSLPLKKGKEWIYPILIDLLNHVQLKTGKKVVITSGHRCPDHNIYVDSAPGNQMSKHQIGAEVDFYVQGMENHPEAIVDIILAYYAQHTNEDLRSFTRYTGDTNVKTKPWMNKEVFIKLYKKEEGRNLDNRHPYPYLGIQVRYDTEARERVVYSWDLAFRNFLRY